MMLNVRKSGFSTSPKASARVGQGKSYWDYKWTMSRPVYHCKRDVVVRDSKTNIWTIIDFAVPLDHNIVDKE